MSKQQNLKQAYSTQLRQIQPIQLFLRSGWGMKCTRTTIPLVFDILFVNSNNEIVTIHKDAIPFDESQYRSTKPAQFVIEVNAGYTDSLRIKEGDKIIWRRN